MNELIRQLSSQAWDYAERNSRDGDGRHGGLYRDKFAELVVRKCAQHCDPIPGLEFSVEVEAARAGCKKDILKHFGVQQ